MVEPAQRMPLRPFREMCWDGAVRCLYRRERQCSHVTLTQAASDVGLAEVSSLMPPEPPPLRSLANALPEHTNANACDDSNKTVRYDCGILPFRGGCCEIRSLQDVRENAASACICCKRVPGHFKNTVVAKLVSINRTRT